MSSDIIHKLKPIADEASIKLNNEVTNYSPTGNHDAVEQIITIFVDNAIKYSPDNSTITIISEVNNKSLIISIVDQGIGVAQKDQLNIFERFYRADNARARHQQSSHGLGLAIAKNIAEHNDYKLAVKSEVGKGSVFSLIINS